jgi:hypothetical protein
MKKYIIGAVVLLVANTIVSCGSGSSEISVNWNNYSPELKQRIDSTNDCSKLQNEFNTASANSDMQRARTGEGNLNLMDYIDNRMQKLGCY